MSKNKFNDILSWELFYKTSKKSKSYKKKVELYNRLVCHTENFFAIAGYGSFTKGYLIILTKELLPSFALIKKEHKSELEWFINMLNKSVQEIYKRKTVMFEHGMCSCVGGLDRAHCHLMTIDKQATKRIITDAINQVLLIRRAGIEFVEFNGIKLKNLYDINEIIKTVDKKNYKIKGSQYKLKNLKNLDELKWPYIAKKHVNNGGHYVYFKSDFKETSFLTSKNFQTQLGRQISYQIELNSNNKFREDVKKIQKKNLYANIWRWQEFIFENEILNTLNKMKKHFEIIDKFNLNKFNFKYL